DEAAPGRSIFHLMFLSSAHSVGGWASGATPLESGPRHWAQNLFASAESAAEACRAASTMSDAEIETVEINRRIEIAAPVWRSITSPPLTSVFIGKCAANGHNI